MEPEKNKRLIPLTHWPKYHPWPSVGGLRHMVVKAKTTGFDVAIVRVGQKILIDEDQFFQWCQKQNLQSKGEQNE